MDSQLFEDWVREQDRKFEREGRKVALVVDNCPTHLDVADLKERGKTTPLKVKEQSHTTSADNIEGKLDQL